MPDYTSVLNEFVWQTEDYVPEFPKIHKFLWHWKNNIEATIKDINLCYYDKTGRNEYINCKQMFDI
jgi:uncharacterized protein Usg